MIYNLTEENFDETLSDGKAALVDFWAPWCGPCMRMSPIVEEIAEENPDAAVCKVNVDMNPNLAAKYGVSSIPTFMIIKNGEVVESSLGACGKAQLEDMLARANG